MPKDLTIRDSMNPDREYLTISEYGPEQPYLYIDSRTRPLNKQQSTTVELSIDGAKQLKLWLHRWLKEHAK